MQAQVSNKSILRDLALIYISLAHSTDEDLSEPEVEMISERLRAWQTHATHETVLSAIKYALDHYTQEKAQEEVEQAVRRVRDEVEQELRQVIVDDLVEIALADDRFLSEEGSFIARLASAWDVHFEIDDGKTPWTILGSNGHGNGWTSIHDLALMYLHLAHSPDKDVAEAEMDAIANKLSEWIPDATEERVLKFVHEAMAAYVQGPDKRVFEASVDALRKVVPVHQRAALLADLIYVANADGSISPQEQELIDRLSRAWGLHLDEQES